MRAELGVRMPGEMGGDEVAQLPGAGGAGRTAWRASADGGLQEPPAAGGGGAEGVCCGQRGGGVPGVEHICGMDGGGGSVAQQPGRVTRRRRLWFPVRRG